MNVEVQNPILTLLRSRSQEGVSGLYSCCSANEYVIRAALRRAKSSGTVALVEATANQVNQDGGYTGIRVADDDPNARLSDTAIARRGARLCRAAEEVFGQYRTNHPPAPVYVIGSEVPIPGGARENENTRALSKM